VAQHFGTAENPKPAFAKFNGYFNVDGGTGRIRGASVFGPAAAAATLSRHLSQFEDLGVYGATTTNSRKRAAPTALHSMLRVSPASAWARMESSTTAIPGIQISTPWKELSKEM